MFRTSSTRSIIEIGSSHVPIVSHRDEAVTVIYTIANMVSYILSDLDEAYTCAAMAHGDDLLPVR
jgi:hypothetical protein